MNHLRQRLRLLSEALAVPKLKRAITLILTLVTLVAVSVLGKIGFLNEAYLVLLTTGSIGLFVWAWPRPLLGLTGVFLYTQPLLLSLSTTSDYNTAKIIYSLWAISLLWVLWIGYAAWRQRTVDLTRLVWPTLALLIAMIASLLHAEHLWADLQHIGLFVWFAAFGVLVANLTKTRADVLYVIGSLLVAALIAAVYGLLQYAGVLAGPPDSTGGTGAIISSFGNRNYLGGFLVYLYLPGFALMLLGRSVWIRGFAIATLATLYISFIAIASDSVWLAWLASLSVGGLLVLLLRLWRTVIQQWVWIVGLVAVTALATMGLHVISMGLPDDVAPEEPAISSGTPFLTRALQFTRDPALIAEIRTFQSRLIDWAIGYDMLADAPLIGIGLGDYKRQWLDYKAEFYPTPLGQRLDDTLGRYLPRAAQAHNEYVQIGAEIGLLGLLATLGFIGVLGYEAFRRLRPVDDAPGAVTADGGLTSHRWLVVGLIGGIIAFMSDSIFSFPLHLPPNALAFAALLGCVCSPALGPAQCQVRLRGIGRYAVAVVVLLLAVGMSGLAYRQWAADIHLQAGQSLLQSGDRRGIELIEQSIDLDLAPGEANYWLGALYAYNERPDEALYYLNRAQPIFNNEFSYYMLAYAHFLNRDWSSAERYLRKLDAMEPPPTIQQEADYLQAVIAANRGQLESAQATFQRLLDEDFQPVKMNVNLAEVYLQLRQTALAQTHLVRASEQITQERRSLDDELAEESARDDGLQPVRKRMEELSRLSQRIDQLMVQITR